VFMAYFIVVMMICMWAACEQLNDPSVLVFRGGNGEAEVNPERDVTLLKWQGGVASQISWPKAEKEHKRLKHNLDLSRLTDHWSGEQVDQFGEQAVRQTLASCCWAYLWCCIS